MPLRLAGFSFGGNYDCVQRQSRRPRIHPNQSCRARESIPLLCPVREADWLPGWKYRLIYSDSGVAELGCVFTTPNPPGSAAPDRASAETTWIVTDYDPAAFRIAYLWINPGRVITELVIQLTRSGVEETRSHIRYRYTGLSPEGNREL